MKLSIFATLLLCFAFFIKLSASEESDSKIAYPEGKCYLFRVLLSDKNGTTYSIDKPKEFLSTKAVIRRQRQNIKVDSTDLPVSSVYMNTIKDYGVHIIGVSKWNNTLLIRSDNLSVVDILSKLPFVKKTIKVWTSPDSITPPRGRLRNHNMFNKWDTIPDKYYGAGDEQIKVLNGMKLHDEGFVGKGMTIAILDGGFMNADVISAFDKSKIEGSKDFVYPSSNSVFEETDHGTKVMSEMASYVPHILIGTAYQASFWLIRCEDRLSESLVEEDYWAEAAEFADSVGVDIINSSLGYSDFDDQSTNHRYSDMDGEKTLISHTASMLAKKGIILVNSAGNTGMGTWKKIAFPADAKDILCVGAIGKNRVNAPFSGVGPTQDGRIKPDVMAIGSPAAVVTGRGTLIQDTGTSFSAPILCGLVACLWQALPHLTATEIMDLIRRSGNNYATPDNIYGYGVPDFWHAYLLGNSQLHKTNTNTK